MKFISSTPKLKNKPIPRGFFIAGTDTDIGKTFFGSYLLKLLKKMGYKTVALKPIASGCTLRKNKFYNQDALILQSEITESLPYKKINPLAFEEPIAPHLACDSLSVKKTLKACQKTLNHSADFIVIEGCGGWMTPLNEQESFADLAKALGYPVILVVGTKLGCLNHALLTLEHMKKLKVPLAGWVANLIDPNMLRQKENILSLKKRIPAPCLGALPKIHLSD